MKTAKKYCRLAKIDRLQLRDQLENTDELVSADLINRLWNVIHELNGEDAAPADPDEVPEDEFMYIKGKFYTRLFRWSYTQVSTRNVCNKNTSPAGSFLPGHH